MRYTEYPLTLSDTQLEKVLMAAKKHEGTVIRLRESSTSDQNAPHKLPLTRTQIAKIQKTNHGFNLKLSAAQLKYLEKSGGFLPLLALLPLIFGGLGAAGAFAGGVASAVSSAKNIQAAATAQAESERHNREIESELRKGSGIISDKIRSVPILGSLVPYLNKIGLGNHDCQRLLNGDCVCTKDNINVKLTGNGLFLEPSGTGLFLGKP
jgi:hypothetical protein